MKPSDEKTIEQLLYLLKTRGPQTAATLSADVGTSAVAVRQHMEKLALQGLVENEDRRESVGRPKKYWRLTGEGDKRFADRHSDLTLDMIASIRQIFGEDGLERLILNREQKALAIYRERLSGLEGVRAKTAELAKIRDGEGYMTEMEEVPDGVLLHENHCPICVAANVCQGFCRSELELFKKALGEGATIQRESHIIAGARRCTYRIIEKA